MSAAGVPQNDSFDGYNGQHQGPTSTPLKYAMADYPKMVALHDAVGPCALYDRSGNGVWTENCTCSQLYTYVISDDMLSLSEQFKLNEENYQNLRGIYDHLSGWVKEDLSGFTGLLGGEDF